jgi:hypothetical protein
MTHRNGSNADRRRLALTLPESIGFAAEFEQVGVMSEAVKERAC